MHPRRAFCRTTLVRRQSRRGWLLVGLIVLLSSVILALVGVTFFLTEHRRNTSLRQNQTKAIYLAQAGVMFALYDIRRGAGVTLGAYDVDDASAGPGPTDDAFVLGGKNADFLLVNMVPAIADRGKLSGQRDRLRNWRLHNVMATAQAQITHMTVSWPDYNPNPPANEGVVRIEINGNRVWPSSGTLSAPQPSGSEIDINDVTISPDTARTGNTIWFSSDNVMQGKLFVDVAFRMGDHVVSGNPLDASIRTARYTPPPDMATRSRDLTIKSLGDVREGIFPFQLWRRLRVEYRACATITSAGQCHTTGEELTQTGAILDYQELAGATP